MSSAPYQTTLFANSVNSQTVVLQGPGLEANYTPEFVDQDTALTWFDQLLPSIRWQQDTITVYGKQHLTPRLSCWMGEPWMSYRYSQHTMQPQAWQNLPLTIKHQVERETGESFNSVLINYYRDGRDSNGWHADDEPELGERPIIASVSLGAARDFYLRRKADHSDQRKLSLQSGSLLMMSGDTQTQWQHHVPKRATAGPRINLTFRTLFKGHS